MKLRLFGCIALSVMTGPTMYVGAASAQTSGSAGSDLVVTGKKVTTKDLENSEPRAAFSKAEILSVVTTGKPQCKKGAVTVPYARPTGFSLDGRNLNADDLIERLLALNKAGKISCLGIQSDEYDKELFSRLSDALVQPHQISLIWAEPDSKP